MKKESNKMSKKAEPLFKKVEQVFKKVERKKIVEFFYEHPGANITVRYLSLKLGISLSTLQYQLNSLKEEGLISSKNQWIDSWQNRLIKTNYYLEKLAKSGLIDFLAKELAASAIILFGSFRKGESEQSSDIDLFIECAKEKELDLKKYEKFLGHKIQLFTKPKITLLPDRLLNNIVNGIKLKGYFTIK